MHDQPLPVPLFRFVLLLVFGTVLEKASKASLALVESAQHSYSTCKRQGSHG